MQVRLPDERRAVRQERSRPLLEAIKVWLDETLQTLSQKSAMAKAIRYALSRWQALGRFCEDGRIAIDNNAAERALRCVALGRNYAHLVIMRSSSRESPAELLTCRRSPVDELHIISEALKEFDQFVRGPIPAGVGSSRLELVERALFH